jgi:phenylacetate-CoA ligase
VERAPIDGSNGELYELLITDLLNYGMPLIRYKINDCVRPGLPICPCGRGFPLIGTIEGRTTDNFYLPNGDVVPGVSLTNRVLQVCPGLKKVQVIQEAVSQFRIRYVPGSGFSIADLDLLRANLRKFFPDGLSWEFEAVNDIQREHSGKTRFCISRVDPKNWKLPEARDGNARSAALAGVTEAAGSSAQVGTLRDGDRVQL